MYVPRVAKRTADGTLRPIFFFFLGFFCFTDFYYIREYEVGRRVSRVLYSTMVIGCCPGERRFLPIIKTDDVRHIYEVGLPQDRIAQNTPQRYDWC